MLDAFIIERIKREREEELSSTLYPLRIEIPHLPIPPSPHPVEDTPPERGVVIIDNEVD